MIKNESVLTYIIITSVLQPLLKAFFRHEKRKNFSILKEILLKQMLLPICFENIPHTIRKYDYITRYGLEKLRKNWWNVGFSNASNTQVNVFNCVTEVIRATETKYCYFKFVKWHVCLIMMFFEHAIVYLIIDIIR